MGVSAPPRTDDLLIEAVVKPILEADGSGDNRKVKLDILVAGFGNKRDSHIYLPQLLHECAAQRIFEGARMFKDHETRAQEEAREGLPRPIGDIAGIIDRTWVATRESDGKTVLRGEADIVDDDVWNKVKRRPDILGVSINGRGPSRPGEFEGRQGRVVEAIRQVKSVDWVSFAGAGGGVHEIDGRRITEAAIVDDLDDVMELREADEGKRDSERAHRAEEHRKGRGRRRGGRVRCSQCGNEQENPGRCLGCGANIGSGTGDTQEGEREEPRHDFVEGERVDVYTHPVEANVAAPQDGVVLGNDGPEHLQVRIGRNDRRVHHTRLRHQPTDLTESDLEGFEPMRTTDWLAEADAELEDDLEGFEEDGFAEGDFDEEFDEDDLGEGDWYAMTGSRGGEWIPRDEAELDRSLRRSRQPRFREADDLERPLSEADYDEDFEEDEPVGECDVTYEHRQTGRRHRARGLSHEEARRHAHRRRREGHRNVRIHEAEPPASEDDPLDEEIAAEGELEEFDPEWEGIWGPEWHAHHDEIAPDQDGWAQGHLDTHMSRPPTDRRLYDPSYFAEGDDELDDEDEFGEGEFDEAELAEANRRAHRRRRRRDRGEVDPEGHPTRRRREHHRGRRRSDREHHAEHREGDLEEPLEEFRPEWEGEFGPEWDGFRSDHYLVDPLDTHMSRPPTDRRIHDPGYFIEADEDGVPADEVDMDADREVEERASELANQRVASAVEAARAEMQETLDRKLAENDSRWRKKFEQRGQRDSAFGLIEESGLPLNSQLELKREFADVLIEADTDNDGVETQSAAIKLKRSVEQAIQKKKDELAGVLEATFRHGESTVASQSPIADRSVRESRRPAAPRDADQQVDAALGIAPTPSARS